MPLDSRYESSNAQVAFIALINRMRARRSSRVAATRAGSTRIERRNIGRPPDKSCNSSLSTPKGSTRRKAKRCAAVTRLGSSVGPSAEHPMNRPTQSSGTVPRETPSSPPHPTFTMNSDEKIRAFPDYYFLLDQWFEMNDRFQDLTQQKESSEDDEIFKEMLATYTNLSDVTE